MANLNGKKGSKKHQDVQKAEKEKARAEYEKKAGIKVTTEATIATPMGKKQSRVADVAAFSLEDKTIQYHKIIQVGKTDKNGEPVKREKEAIEDIEKHTEIKVTFVDYTTYKLEEDEQAD